MARREYRDSEGKTLADYPRPSVAVDTAVLTLDENLGLVVLEVYRPKQKGWALPGTFIHPGETLARAVNRSLAEKAGVKGLSPHQLQVFDEPDRDDRGWVLSVAHVDVVRSDRLMSRFADATRLASVDDPGDLPYDHNEIVEQAVGYIRARYASTPDPDRFLDDEFTIRTLRRVHEQVLGDEPQRDWFRRTMEPQLSPTGTMVTSGRGRPAELFRREDRR